MYDYFRAVLHSGEKSERVLELTEDGLDLNPANYTVWYYRREVLKALGTDLKKELQYCREMIEENPKNYQVWQHRRVLVEWLQDPTSELRFTELILAGDQKNYHAWQHRQWVLSTFKLWNGELDFIDRLLEDDIRNNSAWNQRFFVISHCGGFTDEVAQQEVDYALTKINLATRNESAWNYLRGVLDHCDNEEKKAALRSRVREACEKMLAEGGGGDSPCLLGFMVELLQQDLEDGEQRGELARIQELCHTLATSCDSIRHQYWQYVRDTVTDKYGTPAADS